MIFTGREPCYSQRELDPVTSPGMGGAVAAEHMTESVRLPKRIHWHAAMPCLKNPRPGTGPVLDALSDLRGIPASMSGGRLLSSGTEFCLGQQEAVVTGRSDMQDASSGSDPRQQRLDPSIAKMRFDSRHCPLQAARTRPQSISGKPAYAAEGIGGAPASVAAASASPSQRAAPSEGHPQPPLPSSAAGALALHAQLRWRCPHCCH